MPDSIKQPYRIVFTGGNTAGHVVPNIPLITAFKELGWDIHYLGTIKGVEGKLIPSLGVTFHSIKSGKLRRYFALKNATDVFLTLLGITQALRILLNVRPKVIFSKGGFVSVPVILAGWALRVPIVAHESDVTLSLSTRIALRLARRVCCAFERTARLYPGARITVTGLPIRPCILSCDRNIAAERLKFVSGRPILLVLGGSLGASKINQAVRAALPELVTKFDVVHITGSEAQSDLTSPGYVQLKEVYDGFGDILAAAQIVVSRAGATVLHELFAARKPAVLIPLSLQVSRGDQVRNAAYAADCGYAEVLQEEDLLLPGRLAETVTTMQRNLSRYNEALVRYVPIDGTREIMNVIFEIVKNQHGK